MTLWLSNLAAFSIQLAALVIAGAVIVAALRLDTPRVTLRFWQSMLVASIAWPAWQLLAPRAGVEEGTSAATFISTAAMWPTSASSATLHSAIGSVNTGLVALLLWAAAAGAAVRLLWILIGLSRLQSLHAMSGAADELNTVTRSLQEELGVNASVRYSDAVTAPATFGVRRPTILLPRRVSQFPAPLQRAVLCHELLHVRRRDWLATLLEEFWCAVLWFHPAARTLASRLSLAREALVDALTIAHTGDRRAYAAALLAFDTVAHQPLGVTGLIGRRHLEQRIALIAQEVRMPRLSLAFRIIVATSVVCGAAVAATSGAPLLPSLHAQTERIYKPSDDPTITLPQVVREVKPSYTAAAMQARIQGTVWLTVVISRDGDVANVTVAKSLDKEHGLDEEAVKATRLWTFKPGAKDGKPVPVEVTIEMTFTLKK